MANKFKLVEDITKIKNSNFVFFFQNKEDLKRLSFLKLEKNILNKELEIIKKGKSEMTEFFVGNKQFERIYLIFYSFKENIDIFLGDCFRKLPKNFTILSNSEKNVVNLLNSSLLARYKYNEFKTKREEDEIFFVMDKKSKKIAKDRLETIENIILSRNLASKPSNILYPKSFIDLIEDVKFKNTKVKVFNEKDIEEKGLNLLLTVGKGSHRKPYMVIFERIIDKKKPTIGFVCKGITFDTSGIQVKPGSVMYEMKGDMSGAGTGFAIAKELDEKKLNVNVVICLVLAENQISECSYRPSDIVKSYSGKTIDIVHTDAEGRLILADGISYLSDNYKLDKVITLATLTGACSRALGYRYSGVLGNDEEIIGKLLKFSENNIERYWRLPFDNYFIEKTKGKEADLENLNDEVLAGASMGAAFLYNFVLNKERFTHIDLSAAINSYEPFGYMNLGMTGFGVDSLSQLIQDL